MALVAYLPIAYDECSNMTTGECSVLLGGLEDTIQ